MSRRVCLILAPLCVSFCGWAGFDAYLKIPDVEGEAKAEGHKDWIELLSVANEFKPGDVAGAGASSVLKVTKRTDRSSPILAAYCTEGAPLSSARLELMQTAPSAVRFFDVQLSNVVITAVSVGAENSVTNDVPVEELALNFGKIEWTYTIVRGSSRLPLELRSASWDFATATAIAATNAAVFVASGIREESGNVVLNWPGTTGRVYDVYACPNVSGPYSLTAQFTATSNGPMSHTAPILPGTMFYTVEERP